jgi:hypothetical protein
MTRTAFLGLFLLAGAVACGDGIAGTDDGGMVTVAVDLGQARTAGFDIDRVTVTFTHADTEEEVSRGLQISGTSASGEVDLRPGRWDVEVSLYDGEQLAGSGAGSVLVLTGFITEVNIAIELATGGVVITVDWAEDFAGLIADLSHRPVQVEIAGIGDFTVSGLSRIGWDIEVIETPSQQGRTDKNSGVLTYPDVAMVGLTGIEQDAEQLAAWIQGPRDPRVIQLRLQGLAGETAIIQLHGVSPVGGDPSVMQDGDVFTVGGVLFGGITEITLVDYEFDSEQYPQCPLPGKEVEINFSAPEYIPLCYRRTALNVPLPGSSDPLYLSAVRNGEAVYNWALGYRDDVEVAGCVGCADHTRRTASVIDRDASGDETDRVNLFEIWVSSFSLFVPNRRYGQGLLFDLNIVIDLAEQG